jgi:hypothetical protein
MTEEMAKGGVLVHVLEPVRPFWMKVSLKEHLGRNLFVRAGTAAWSAPGIGAEEGESAAGPPSLSVGTWTVKAIEREHEPRRLSALVHDLVRNGGFHIDAPPISGIDIARVVSAFGPQAIIDSILSEEWERWGECRWLSARDRIEAESAAAREGKTALDAAFAEFETLWSALDATMASGPRMPAAEAAELLLAMLLRSRLLEFVAAQRALKGAPGASRREEIVERYRSAVSRLHGRASEDPRSRGSIDQAITRIEEADEETCRSAIRSYARAGRIAHHDLVMILAKAHQKPHHAIRRATIVNANERDRVFPTEHCWNGSWYVGPDDQRADGLDSSM